MARQNQKRRLQKRTNRRSSYSSRIWAAAAALIIAAGFGTLAFFAGNRTSDTPHLKLSVNTPQAIGFTDSTSTVLIQGTNVPDVNNNRRLSSITPLVISYEWTSGPYADALKMNLTDEEVAKNVKITPFIRGNWQVRDNSALAFTPDADWPADTKFTVKINDDILNPDAEFDKSRISFTTAPAVATIDSFNIYPDQKAKKHIIGAAVISFNYPIETKDFANRVSLKLDGKKLDFSVRLDRFNRTAIITSAPVAITEGAQIMRLKLNSVPTATLTSTTKKITAHATVESADNIFKIASITTGVADNTENIRQLIILNTTASADSSTDWSKYIHAYLLPKFRDATPDEDAPSHEWANDEITPEVLEKSSPLQLTPTDFVSPSGVYQYAFEYAVSDKSPRYIYVSVAPGIESTGEFVLRNGLTRVLSVIYPEKSVKIAGTGALLSMAGDRKLGIAARGGVESAYINLYKVKSDEINHLISQTYDVFADNIDFKSWSFGIYDMAAVFTKKVPFANTSRTSTSYASIDLGDYLDRTGADKTGIFIIQTGADENAAQYSDRRMILLTDLGIIRKLNADNSSTLFVSNLSTGNAASDVEVEILGRNGNAVWAGRTDNGGVANLPTLAWDEYRDARAPVAIVARRGSDTSFIPYNAYDQRTDYSKFDTDGTYSATSSPLNAFLFSDRGVYRPGEQIVIGGVVKNKSFKPLSGIPVKLELRDARGRIALERTFSLASDGLFDIKYTIDDAAPLGEWQAALYSLTPKNKIQNTLGTTTIQISEFIPDTMKITASIAGASDTGWLSPENLTANVSLRNLFGTPATKKQVKAHATLTPVTFTFADYPEYTFTPNFIANTGVSENTSRRTQTFSTDIEDITTDENGTANIDIKFKDAIPSGTYNLNLNISGYEANSGRNVQTNLHTRVSDLKYVVGYHASGDLSFINRRSQRSVNLIAIDNTGARTTADGVAFKLIHRENLTSLIKDYKNFYKYQTVTRDNVIKTETITIPDAGLDIALDTNKPGTYYIQISDASNRVLANLEYFVADKENTTLSTDTNADLQIKLDASEYQAGQDITVNITAPYRGAGLITIERDKVYAYKWFTANGTSTQQKIKVPNGFTGTGYVNVSFVRNINSPDIFTTPYAYAAAPFTANIDAHRINIKLSAPDKITDDKLTVKYTSDKKARMMIFAVNTGILQVAKYQIPNPLTHFFQKAALQVDTFQTLSLLLPEYKILREFAKTGGSDYDYGTGGVNQILTNPFARRTLPAAAFYSDILNVSANKESEITFNIPDYFNGSVQVFAVAAADNAVGAADTTTVVQSPVMISTNAPLFAAPNDKFAINAVITNLTGTPDNTAADVEIKTSDNLTITSATSANIAVADGAENLATFTASVQDKLGNANINITAKIGDNTRQSASTLSVRPATTYTTALQTKIINRQKTTIDDIGTNIYPEFATQQISVSADASAYVRPLVMYLNKYEFPCTEQLTSRGIGYVLSHNDALIGNNGAKISEIINTLKNRQNDDGSFALWAATTTTPNNASDADSANLTAYVTQFLTLARRNGFTVPNQMISRALDYLRTYAAQNITSVDAAYATAAAIYVITENDFVTTGYIDAFEEYANDNMPDWQSDISGTYIAAAYKMLHQDDMANKLINKYRTARGPRFEYESVFRNNVANDAMYYYIANRYFDRNTTDILDSDVIAQYISSGDFSSYTSAAVIMGLSSADTSSPLPEITVTADKTELKAITTTKNQFVADIPMDTKKITINCKACDKSTRLFATTLQQGFPRVARPATRGLDIAREYYDASGNRITSGNIGDIVTVRISVRTRGTTNNADNIVISDLLPAGLAANSNSLTGDAPTFAEFREDRVLIFTNATRQTQTFEYTATLNAAGTFTTPAINAQSMYNPAINATGGNGTFTVSNDTNN